MWIRWIRIRIRNTVGRHNTLNIFYTVTESVILRLFFPELMNLLATASDLQIKGLSQIQETRTTQLTSEATPLPEVKPAAKQQTPAEVNKVKPAAELRVKPVAPAPPPPSSIGHEGRVSEESPDLQHPQQHAGNSLKRKHDQSGSDHHSRISFRSSNSSSSGWSGGGSQHSSRHQQQQQQQDCEERQVAVALRDLKTEVGELGSSSSSGSTGALAPLHSEDTRVTTQVPVLPYLQQEHYGTRIFFIIFSERQRSSER
jgi:hypothetical protein